eukprot:3936151-Rhodomonas_salina.3
MGGASLVVRRDGQEKAGAGNPSLGHIALRSRSSGKQSKRLGKKATTFLLPTPPHLSSRPPLCSPATPRAFPLPPDPPHAPFASSYSRPPSAPAAL